MWFCPQSQHQERQDRIQGGSIVQMRNDWVEKDVVREKQGWPVYHAPLWGQPGLSTVGDVHHSGGISTIRDAASIHPCSISIGPWGHHLLRCLKSLVVPRSEPHKPIFGNSGEQNCFVWDAQNRAFSSGGTTIMGMKNVQQPDPPSLARLTFAGQWPGPPSWLLLVARSTCSAH